MFSECPSSYESSCQSGVAAVSVISLRLPCSLPQQVSSFDLQVASFFPRKLTHEPLLFFNVHIPMNQGGPMSNCFAVVPSLVIVSKSDNPTKRSKALHARFRCSPHGLLLCFHYLYIVRRVDLFVRNFKQKKDEGEIRSVSQCVLFIYYFFLILTGIEAWEVLF